MKNYWLPISLTILLTVYLILCLGLAKVYSKDYQESMTLYNDNYFLAGNKNDQVKVQISAKYNVFYLDETPNPGLYLGYTQTSNWICYDKRDKFKTMYQPEAFLKLESGKNIFHDYAIPYIDYIQISPICHNSTGVEGDEHRGINIYYAQIQPSIGEVYNFGFNLKGFGYYSKSVKNRDIAEYKGYYEIDTFFIIRSKTVQYFDKEELHFKFGGNPFNKGWYCIEARFRIISSKIQPKLFFSWYRGFNEFMVNYNKKTDSFRVGLVF